MHAVHTTIRSSHPTCMYHVRSSSEDLIAVLNIFVQIFSLKNIINSKKIKSIQSMYMTSQ